MEHIFRQWIGMHRAMIAWFHAAHHVTKGTGFGGDHVNLYGEIYTQLDEDLDGIVEKGIGLTGDETLADPVSSLSMAAGLLAQQPASANQDAETIAANGLQVIKYYVDFIEKIYSQFESMGMSLGLDDLLQGHANQYETYVYLLQQRSRGTVMKITETKLRKAIRKVILESIFKSKRTGGRPGRSAGDDRYWDLARAYHQQGGTTIGGRYLDTIPSDKEEVIRAIEHCREWTRNYVEETGYDPRTSEYSDWPDEYLAEFPSGNITKRHLYFICDAARMEMMPEYKATSLLDQIKNDRRFRG